jgi:hypothetical protein
VLYKVIHKLIGLFFYCFFFKHPLSLDDHTTKGALRTNSIVDWLKQQQSPNTQHYTTQQSRFARTLAGAVVLDHVLGVGDRHSDNILMQPDGTIFHIDFGCVFGKGILENIFVVLFVLLFGCVFGKGILENMFVV